MSDAHSLPRLYRVRQSFPGAAVADLATATQEAMDELDLAARVTPGARIAIAIGSRGIANLAAVCAAAVAHLRSLGADPFIVPAMGSHGGASAQGQAAVLAGYGITEQAMAAPVISQPQVLTLGQTRGGVPLYADRLAAEADGVLVINRVKPHTDFTGRLESGPNKMLAIGLGKWHAARACHSHFVLRGYDEVLREVGSALWNKLPLLGALAPVENGHHETVRIGAVRPASAHSDEEALLALARECFGYLPFERLDILVLDRIGKDVSGSGMDPNVTGADGCKLHGRGQTPFIWRICIRGLSPASHGNATGIGNADYVLRRCVQQIDWAATFANTVAAASPEGARCPVTFDTDQEMLSAAMSTSGPQPATEKRLVWCRDTLAVDELLISEALVEEAGRHPNVIDVQPYVPGLSFDTSGFLASPWQ